MKTWTKRLAIGAGALTLAGVLMCGGGFVALNEPAPVGVSDAAADTLANEMIDSVDERLGPRPALFAGPMPSATPTSGIASVTSCGSPRMAGRPWWT